MKKFFGHLLCTMGLHDFNKRTNGKAMERVCQRCEYREKLYSHKDGGLLWNKKKIPVRGGHFTKTGGR